MNGVPRRICAELVGGPLDGHEVEVALQAAESPVYLFRTERDGGGFHVWAYEFANRTTAGGRRWVLQFLYRVARQGGVS